MFRFENLNPIFVTSKIVCNFSWIEFRKYFEQLVSGLNPLPFSQGRNPRDFYPLHFFHRFRLPFNICCILWYFQNDMQLWKRWLCATSIANTTNCVTAITFNYFLTFETFVLHVTISSHPEFAASLTDTAPIKISLLTYELSFKIPFKTHILILHKNNKPKTMTQISSNIWFMLFI